MRSKVLRYAVPILAVLLAAVGAAADVPPFAPTPLAAQEASRDEVREGGQEAARDAGRTEAEEHRREYRIKAAFLYNFAKFTLWPTGSFVDSEAPFRICVYGEDPFGAALESIAGKRVQGHRVEVARPSDPDRDTTCHLLFVSESEAPNLVPILAKLRHRPVLTVADMPGFADAGGIINLKINEEDKIRFEINLAGARLAGLRLSAKLLSLAEIAQY